MPSGPGNTLYDRHQGAENTAPYAQSMYQAPNEMFCTTFEGPADVQIGIDAFSYGGMPEENRRCSPDES